MDQEDLTICPRCECVVTYDAPDQFLNLDPDPENPQYHRTCIIELKEERHKYEVLAPLLMK